MSSKKKILKNHLNLSTFNQSLLNQQNNLIELYNNINLSDKNMLRNESMFYLNNQLNIQFKKIKEEELSKSSNIFEIRLNQTKDNLRKSCIKRWPNINICKNILELKGNVKIINII